MVTYLHQIIAVDRSIETDTARAMEEIGRILAVGGKQDPLTGLFRTHQSRDPDRWPDIPPETRRVQVTVSDLLGQAQNAMVRLFDVKFAREVGNAAAAADIIVEGDDEPLLTNVPAGYLLFLQGRIESLITTLIDRMPVRDPAEDWHDQATDPNLPRGVWASAPRLTPSTTKETTAIVGYDATEHQPAQIKWVDTDVTTGTKTLVNYSGQLSVRDVQEMRARAVKILVAVRYAREKANMLEVDPQHVGGVILSRIFGDLVPSA